MKIFKSVLTLAALSCSLHADVIVTGGWLTTGASAFGPGPTVGDVKSDVPANSLEKTTSTAYGGVTDNTIFDYAVSGSTGHLLTSFNSHADAVAGQYGDPVNQGEIDFTVTGAPVTYFISGEFAVSGASGESLTNTFWTGKTNLLNNFQSSNSTTNEDFLVGGTGGDVSNTMTGSLTGVLGVGSYVFAYTATTQTYQGGSLSADGFFRIDFGAPAPAPAAVPEPSTFAFMGLGLMGLFAARRSRHTGRR